MKLLNFPFWKTRDEKGPYIPFEPSVNVIRRYAADIEKHGMPLDSGLPAYFRKCADYFEWLEY